MNLLAIRAVLAYWTAGLRNRAAVTERGQNTMEIAIIIVSVLAVAAAIAGTIALVANQKIDLIK